MLGSLARFRMRPLVGLLLWLLWVTYALLVAGITGLAGWAGSSACDDPTPGGSKLYPRTWRWRPPVGWECDFTEIGLGVERPGWGLTVAIALVPAGLAGLVATRVLATRWLRDAAGSQSVEEGVG